MTNKEDLRDGDIVWNNDDKFKEDNNPHLNLIVDNEGYTMTSSADRGTKDRIHYTQEDVHEGFLVVGNKFITNNRNTLKRNRYTLKGTVKPTFLQRFIKWLKA